MQLCVPADNHDSHIGIGVMEEYNFVVELPDDFMCMICSKVLIEPHVTDCCGQHFCQSCLDEWFRKQGGKNCPHCRSERFSHILYLPLKRKIQALKVYCPNQKYGCGTTISINDFKGHVEKCSFANVACELGCGRSMLKKDSKQHLTNECPKRKVKCQHCLKEDSYDFIIGQHTDSCNEYPIYCPRGCMKIIMRKDLPMHAEVCLLENVQCVFHDVGCKARALRKDLQEHLQQNQQDHLSQLMVEFSKLNSDHKRLSDEHKQVKSDHKKLSDEHKHLKSDHERVTDELKQVQGDHKRLSDGHDQLKSDYKMLLDENKQVKSDYERQLSGLRSQQQSMSSQISKILDRLPFKCKSCGEFWVESHSCKRR